MKKLLLAIFFCSALTSRSLIGQEMGNDSGIPEKYSRVRIFTDESGLRQLALAGVTIDHGNYRKGVFFESDFSSSEIKAIQSSGLKYEIKIDDVSRFYAEQNFRAEKSTEPEIPQPASTCGGNTPSLYPTPSNFSLGTMGGFYKYSEFLAHLDSMASKFPNLITARQPIDTFQSVQGRDIYWLKISDNPSVDETEPELMYTALHHAREPASLSQLIFYMWYLLENYGTDPEVTYLVDNTEMFFVPMVNPDGYYYNQTTNPNGGGMWRKNRKNNGNSTYGIDLNRNYGHYWGYDDTGSSPNTSSDTYRGPSAFSEPETKAMKWFCENHDFLLVLNYHTYGDLFIYPWGYEENIYTPDSAYFVNYALEATRDNAFATGTGNQTVGYVTNGDSDDWMYGEQSSKNKILSATPEAGPGDLGFWPAASDIIELCRSNITQNFTMAHCALEYARVKDQSPQTITSLNGYFPLKIHNLGLDTPSAFTVSIIPAGNEFSSVGSPLIMSNLGLLEERTDSISFSLNSTIAPGTSFQFIISVDNGLYVSNDTITKVYGQQSVAFTDNGDNLNNWNTQTWGISTTVYQSPSSSITDSPVGNYSTNSDTWIDVDQPVDLSNAIDAMLTYWARWEIEPGWDYVQVKASADNGATWTALCGKYTKTGNSNQAAGEPLYDGMQQNWVPEEVSLKNFIGSQVLIRFTLTSDGYVDYDGFYFDDLKLSIIPSVQQAAVNSLTILPSAPTEDDTVKVIAGSVFPFATCVQTSVNISALNDTFRVNATHSLGAMTVVCNSEDTAVLGKLQAGDYTLIYFLDDSATSTTLDKDTLNFTVLPALGIQFQDEKYFFRISPNPVSNSVFCSFAVPEDGSLKFYNSLGKIVLEISISAGKSHTIIDLSDLGQGIYFYEIYSENYRSGIARMAVVR